MRTLTGTSGNGGSTYARVLAIAALLLSGCHQQPAWAKITIGGIGEGLAIGASGTELIINTDKIVGMIKSLRHPADAAATVGRVLSGKPGKPAPVLPPTKQRCFDSAGNPIACGARVN